MPGDSVFIRKLGNSVLLIPKDRPWDSLVEACGRFLDDFMTGRDQGVQEREGRFE